MDNSTNRLQVGRVIFREDCWIIQTLRNHVGNVTKLTKLWQNEQAFQGYPPNLEKSRGFVIQAAEIHDMAKPQCFRLDYKQNKFNENKWEWTYSFSGHRFEARHDHFYVETLAQLHHEYSVEGIAKARARLRLNNDETLCVFADNLPLDLYALEMCDQIEATIACTVLEDKNPEARVFMDFQFNQPDKAILTYQIDPFVFEGEQVQLQIEYTELSPDQTLKQRVEAATDDSNRQKLLQTMKNWLLEELQQAQLSYKEVTLCRWI